MKTNKTLRKGLFPALFTAFFIVVISVEIALSVDSGVLFDGGRGSTLNAPITPKINVPVVPSPKVVSPSSPKIPSRTTPNVRIPNSINRQMINNTVNGIMGGLLLGIAADLLTSQPSTGQKDHQEDLRKQGEAEAASRQAMEREMQRKAGLQRWEKVRYEQVQEGNTGDLISDQHKDEVLQELRPIVKSSAGTAFFGIPANPSNVDLNESNPSGTPFFHIPANPSDVALNKPSISSDVSVKLKPLVSSSASTDPFIEFQNRMIQTRLAQDEKFARLLSHIPPPQPFCEKFRIVEEGVILGMWNSQKDADNLLKKGKNPFSCEDYASLHKSGRALALAFGHGNIDEEHFSWSHWSYPFEEKTEVRRVPYDHFYPEHDYTINMDQVQYMLPSIQCTKFKRLIAHSNGATVTEALIRKGIIRHVEELHIMGGDRSLDPTHLQELIDSKMVGHITVWVNTHDLVPWLTNLDHRAIELVKKAGATATFVREKWDPALKNLFNQMNNMPGTQVKYITFEGKNQNWPIIGKNIDDHLLGVGYFPQVAKVTGCGQH
jgi:hypothetical protein